MKCQINEIVPKFVNGDPRNIGLIGHWDGWQPGFGHVSSHSSGMDQCLSFFKT